MGKIQLIKKKFQSLFKNFFYKLFMLFHGKINGVIDYKNKNFEIKHVNFDDNTKYRVFEVSKCRLYTDTIHDTAVILENKILEGPSFQYRNNKNYSANKNIVFTKGTPKIKRNLNGSVMSLLTGGGGNNNYWHWLYDVLPRFHILEKLKSIKDIDFFLLPNLERKFQIETLDILGIPKEKRLSSINHRHIFSDKLFVVDHPYNLKNDPTIDSLHIPKWIIKYLKDNFLKFENEQNNFPKKFFIDRSDAVSGHAKMRKIVNENEVKKELQNNGFQIVTLSNYHFKDQVKMFNNAESIVGLHGAGFANVVFCKPKTKIIELQSDSAGDMYKCLSEKNNLNYDRISTKPKEITNNQLGDIEININVLKEKIFIN